MLSVPPVSTMSASPSLISCIAQRETEERRTIVINMHDVCLSLHTCAPLMMDWNPEPHSLLTVRAVDLIGTPASSPTWRAR